MVGRENLITEKRKFGRGALGKSYCWGFGTWANSGRKNLIGGVPVARNRPDRLDFAFHPDLRKLLWRLGFWGWG